MSQIRIKQSPQAKAKLEAYPEVVYSKMHDLRNLILETASEIDSIQEIEETLKWGEPSYLVKKGSTIRMDWKPKLPHQYALYFNCNTNLVESFRTVYGDLFKYEKNRALLFGLEDEVPKQELKVCIKRALKYHSLKDNPFF